MGWSKTEMDKISAACAMDWSIELEKGLRSRRPGEPLDTISQVGPRICRWSREPIVTMAMTDMFGLVQGEDRLFANAILLRLADAFRSGDNNLRACILKVFLLEMKNRKRCKQYNGILAKQRVPNYIELLKRVKVVFDTGDVESRALSLRLLGCWAYLAKDSAEIRYMILTSLESCQILELKASLFAAGCFCELSEDFAFVVLEKLKSMLISLTTSLDTKLAVARVFSNMGCSYLIANRAYKIGKSLALDSSEEEFLIKMLWSLSKLASKSILLIPEQVDLLLSFLSCKSSASVSATAVRCLFLLSVGGISQFPVNASVILTLLHMLDNGDVPLKSQCEAIEILHKVFHFSLLPPNVDVHEFHKLVLIAESVAQSPTVSNRLPVLGLLVDVSCSLKRKMTNCCCYYPDQTSQNSLQDSVVVPDKNGLESLPWRVSVLVMDQITFLIQQVNLESHMVGFTTTSKPKADNVSSKVKQECQCFLNLLLHLVQNYPILGLMALNKVRWLGESLVNTCHTLGIETADNHEVSGMDMDTENSSSSSHKLTEFEGGKHASALEIVICLCQFTVFCLEMLDEVNAVTDEIYDTVKLLVDCIQQSGFLNSNMLVIFSLIVHSCRMRQCFGCENFTFDSAFQNMCHDDCWVDHELMTLEFAKKMMTGSDFWAVYRTGKYAACQGAWFAATFAFRIIIKRSESDACRDWLKSLALFAGAESEIQLLLFPGQGIKLIQGLQKNGDREETSADDDVGNADLSDFIRKLSTAFNRICSAVEMLEADVTSNLPFYFQRWFLSLRAKVLGTVMDIFGLLTSSADAKENMDGNGQLLLQHMHSLASDFNHLSFRLNKFAKEFDLLATSFMDIDPKSFRFISRFALNCSLLAFCTTYIIQFSNLPAYKNSISSTLEGQEKYSPAVVIQDLVERLWNIDSKTCTDLQLFSNLASEKSGYLQSRTQISSTGHRERATLMFCRFAISVVLKMEQEAKRVKDEEDLAQFLQAGLRLLFDIVRQWLHLPFHTPKYFFRVRPCFGAKLFAFNADAQNPGAMSIVRGFCLSLNLCMQMNYPSTKGDVDVTKLYCILAVKRSDCQPIGNGESKRQEQMDFHAWKTDDAVDLNEELLLYLRNTCKSQRMHGAASNGGLVTAFVCFEPNERGQGFSTCLLDVSSFPEGSYQIKWQGCCIDRKGSYWSLLPLNAGPVLNVEPPATTI